jgi:DNA-binding MarR family transcriptional regulator
MRQATRRQGDWDLDAVDRIIEQWREVRPDLDPSAKGITGRIIRMSAFFQEAFRAAFEPLGIGEGDYGVLVVLRRSGHPFELTPSELARQRMMTSGGMTAALDRLERRGLLARAPNPADRRGTLIRLTDAGLEVTEDAMARHTEVEHTLVASLSPAERATLIDLLRRLLLDVEPGASRAATRSADGP